MTLPQRVTLPNGRFAYEDKPGSARFLYEQVLQYFDPGGVVLRPGMTILDVGANAGMFALEVLHQTEGDVHLICCEPAPAPFSLLERTIGEQFPDADVQALQVGLSDAPGEAILHYRPQASAMSSLSPGALLSDADVDRVVTATASADVLKQNKALFPAWFRWLPGVLRRALVRGELARSMDEVVEVPCTLMTVSGVIEAHGLHHIDVLKIDVEGAEWAVLQGIEAHHWPTIKTLALEVHDEDGRLENIRALLSGHGFDTIKVDQEAMFEGTAVFALWASR